MAKTSSNMVPIGFKAPHFNLLNTKSGKILSLDNLAGKKCTLIMFICNHCPFVIHINEEIVNIANEYIKKGVSFIAISSNDIVNYPQDSPQNMKKVALTSFSPSSFTILGVNSALGPSSYVNTIARNSRERRRKISSPTFRIAYGNPYHRPQKIVKTKTTPSIQFVNIVIKSF